MYIWLRFDRIEISFSYCYYWKWYIVGKVKEFECWNDWENGEN